MLEKTEGAIQNGQSTDTCNTGYKTHEDKLIKGKQEWTIYRNWQQWVHKTQDEDKLIKGKQEWTIYRNWQQWVHKTQDEDKLIKNKKNITQ